MLGFGGPCPSGHSHKYCVGWGDGVKGITEDYDCENKHQPKGVAGCPNDKVQPTQQPDCITSPSDPSCIQNTVSPLPGLIPGGNIAATNTGGDTTTPPATNTGGDTNPAAIGNNGAPIDNGDGITGSKVLSPDKVNNSPTDNGGDTTTTQSSSPPDNGGTTPIDTSGSGTDTSGPSNDNSGTSGDSGGGGGDSGGHSSDSGSSDSSGGGHSSDSGSSDSGGGDHGGGCG